MNEVLQNMKILDYTKEKAKELTTAISGQGGIIGFFIGAMIAVVIALQVTWPVMDSVISGTSMANMSSAAQTLVDQLPLFLVLVLLMIFVKAVI